MARKTKILAVCRQSLDNVDYAVRAFCMFRHLGRRSSFKLPEEVHHIIMLPIDIKESAVEVIP